MGLNESWGAGEARKRGGGNDCVRLWFGAARSCAQLFPEMPRLVSQSRRAWVHFFISF